jgi:RND family efflux transporter MFP subunit
MNYDDPNSNESTEEQLRREVEELKRQLRAQREVHTGPPADRWRPSGITISGLLLAFVILMVGAFFAGYIPLQRREATVQAEANEREKSLPRMEVMQVGGAGGENQIKLPGTMQAVTEAPILARADGYLKKRTVDIGDRVTAGQVLAEIDAPELDQQIRQAGAAVEQAQAAIEQAQANLEQGKANQSLARINADRRTALEQQGITPKQDGDQYRAQFAASTANVQALEKAISAQRSNLAAAQANLARLQEVQNYRSVKAPFDGVITLRNVDVGALVSTGNTLLFRIAQTGTLRTYVNVPQADARSVRVGQAAVLTVSNFPGRNFRGTVARTANALDPASRTMLVEIDVPNSEGTLLPGTYAEVNLSGSRPDAPLVLPATSILFRTDGAQVAIVQPDSVIHLQKVTVGRDYGDRVEILQGLSAGATILAAPGDAAREGTKIIPVSRTAETQK